MNQQIVEAIEKRRTLELRYSGYSRTVEPHAYGRDTGGEEVLRCFQQFGGSNSGERSGWKLLKVGEIFSLEVQKTVFTPQPNYKRGDRAMPFLFAQI